MPSAKILAQKQQVVAELTERLQKACAGVIVTYSGITVDNDTKMRSELRKAGVTYTVLKNTMTKRACENVGYGELASVLEGTTALATSETDPVAAAKILKNYADKQSPPSPQIFSPAFSDISRKSALTKSAWSKTEP